MASHQATTARRSAVTPEVATAATLENLNDLVDRVAALENPDDILNRVAAGMRAATLIKFLFSDAEVAVILGVSTEQLRQWRREGRGPAWKRLGGQGGKLVRYTLNGLREYVASLPDEISTQARAASQ